MMTAQFQTILIVDDEPLNLKVLKVHLECARYRVLEASNGLKAIEMAKESPDLILLDVMMPGMDGFETCRRLKAEERTKDIPVIFLSALQDLQSKVFGLDVGGVDYVSKPFQARELLARVRTHLTLRRQELQIKSYATHLEHMVEERTRQLIHADRLATLGTFSAAIVHEINNPNSYIGGNAELLGMFWEHAKPIVEKHRDEDRTGRVAKSFKSVESMVEAILDGSRRITRMVSSLRNYGRQEKNQKIQCRLVDPLNDALYLIGYRLKHDIVVETDVAQDILLWCDPQKLSQVFVNLMNNALDAMEGMKGKIHIHASVENEMIAVRVKDSGPGIPDEMASRAFDPFYTTKPKERGTGLGLFIIRGIVEEHEGQIVLAPFSGDGAEFKILLPVSPRPADR